MKKTLMTAGIALALGIVWTAGPALAQPTTGEKIENKAEKAGDKLERGADKTGDKMKKAADKVGDKTESAWDKTKDKTREMKDKVKDKTSNMTDKAKAKMERMGAKAESKDVMTMQQALKDKGHDPGPVDGVMGPRTKSALVAYQKKEGLKATGRWDDETAAKLGMRMSSDKETVTPSASPSMPSSATSTPSTPAGTSTPPPATPEDKTAPPAKRNAP